MSRTGRLIEFGNLKMTTTQWARRLGLAPHTFNNRLARYPLERALTPGLLKPLRKGKRMITFAGETLSLADWARRLGMTWQGLDHRLARMSVELALAPRPGRRPILVEYAGYPVEVAVQQRVFPRGHCGKEPSCSRAWQPKYRLLPDSDDREPPMTPRAEWLRLQRGTSEHPFAPIHWGQKRELEALRKLWEG